MTKQELQQQYQNAKRDFKAYDHCGEWEIADEYFAQMIRIENELKKFN